MTPFEKLCETYKQSRSKFISDQDGIFALAGALFSGLAAHLGLPGGSGEFFRVFDAHDENAPKMSLALPEAMVSDDGKRWYVGFGFTLYSEPGVSPGQPVLVRFSIRKAEDGFKVTFGSGTIRLLTPDYLVSPGHFEELFGAVTDYLLQNCTSRGDEFVDGGQKRIEL